MFRLSLRQNLLLFLVVLSTAVAVLFGSGLYAAFSIRSLATSVKVRTAELPLAAELSGRVGSLQVQLARLSRQPQSGLLSIDRQMIREQFVFSLYQVKDALERYHDRLEAAGPVAEGLSDTRQERDIVERLEKSLTRIESQTRHGDWLLDGLRVGQIEQEIDAIGTDAAALPALLQARVDRFTGQVRDHHRNLILLSCASFAVSATILGVFLFYMWASIFKPLRQLLHDSRQIAGGDFHHQACVGVTGEMGELATALNDMTGRFIAIRDDLNRQVQQRTKEVVRQEKLASVGFLAAGVAHEINNPLAAIAWSAESLEARLGRLFPDQDDADAATSAGGSATPEQTLWASAKKKLHTIQEEAFRAKGITERLLDYSRMGDLSRSPHDLAEIVTGVVDLIRDLGKYRTKNLLWEPGEGFLTSVNAQEIKQVVLNLLTNALDCVESGGTVTIHLGDATAGQLAELADTGTEFDRGAVALSVVDDGCGMTPEVLEHLFEPFYTRRRDNSGTGLGLSISSRIVYDHGGRIVPESAGPGLGSTFRVFLPKTNHESQTTTRQAA